MCSQSIQWNTSLHPIICQHQPEPQHYDLMYNIIENCARRRMEKLPRNWMLK
jgi:hypothetical protein